MSSSTHISDNGHRRGFTLVEMLVSVGLVLLMMTLFAQVFQIATESVSNQQVISENDQKGRSLVTIIRADVAKRTFRNLVPYFPGELTATSPTLFAERTGYFYVSTNNPESGLDDLLQFTVHADQTRENSDTTRYFGRSDQLLDRTIGPGGQTLANNPNQPEVDDGSLNPNFTSSAPAAQVCYFIRNGDLYRRILMLREPLRSGGQDLDPQPKGGSGVDFFAGYTDNTSAATRSSTYDGQFQTVDSGVNDDFYTHFDFSAIHTPAAPLPGVARILGVGALSNDTTGGGLYALGIPQYRWGFSQRTGWSREHLSSGGIFMGRFLSAETSAPNFNWPQQPAQVQGGTAPLWTDSDAATIDGDPFEMINTNGNEVHTYSMNANGVISDFDGSTTGVGRGGSRAVEDLLLPNVHEFRVEFWDERIQNYLPMGHTSTTTIGGILQPGDFHFARRMTPLAGPAGPVAGRRAFDTWHPTMFPGFPQVGEWPMLLPHQYTPPIAPLGPTPSGIPLEARNRGYYNINNTYSVGDVVFSFQDRNGPNWAAGDPATPPNGVYDVHANSNDAPTAAAFQRAYRCIAVNDLDMDGTIEVSPLPSPMLNTPSYTPGQKITDNEVQWEVIDNTRPVKSMRITIRFQNQKSEEMRQLTIVVPLSDN